MPPSVLADPAARAPAALLPLPPLAEPQLALQRQAARVLRLFHALGGPADWFRAQAWPRILAWEQLVVDLPVAGSRAPGGLLAAVLEAAARAAESPAGAGGDVVISAGQRLALAEQAALRLARAGRYEDPWACAARVLVQRGVWDTRPGLGRWLAAAGGWTLLWPLAGRDLWQAQRALQGCPVPAPGEPGQAALDAVLAGLAAAGHLASPDGPWLRSGIRCRDGRRLRLLPVGPSLRQCAGLAPGLPQRPEVELDRTCPRA